MTPQEIFDIAARGVIRQGTYSAQIGASGTPFCCMYRDGSGNKCAVGHIIPDELYKPMFDDAIGARLGLLLPVLAQAGLDLLEHIQLLKGLQACHDETTFPGARDGNFISLFKGRMRDLAERFGLSAAALDEPVDAVPA